MVALNRKAVRHERPRTCRYKRRKEQNRVYFQRWKEIFIESSRRKVCFQYRGRSVKLRQQPTLFEITLAHYRPTDRPRNKFYMSLVTMTDGIQIQEIVRIFLTDILISCVNSDSKKKKKASTLARILQDRVFLFRVLLYFLIKTLQFLVCDTYKCSCCNLHGSQSCNIQ